MSVECCELLEREKLREMQQLLKQEITDVLFPVSDMEYAGSLKTFEIILQEKLESFCGKGENTTEECLGVHELIKKTQENVLDFNERFAEIIQAMERETTVIKENLDKIYKGLCQGKMNSSDSEFSIAINDARKRLLIGSTLRYYYVQKIEDLLSLESEDSKFLHWGSYFAPIVTRNRKHIRSMHTLLFYV